MKELQCLVFGLIFILFSCTDEQPRDAVRDFVCFDGKSVLQKSEAKKMILGEWNWIKTSYPRRNGSFIDTPISLNENRVYEVTENKINLYIDDILTNEFDYEVQFWAEGTSLEEDQLVVKYGTGEQSILMLSNAGNYLSLINSFNGVGGDICLQKKID